MRNVYKITFVILILFSCKKEQEDLIVNVDITPDYVMSVDKDNQVVFYEDGILNLSLKYSSHWYDPPVYDSLGQMVYQGIGGSTTSIVMHNNKEINVANGNEIFLSHDVIISDHMMFKESKNIANHIPGGFYEISDGQGYIGFRFKNGKGKNCYGWILVEKDGLSITILEYAYNLISNRPIRTGQIGFN